MHFRLIVVVSDLGLDRHEPLEFQYGDRRPISVVVRVPTDQELPRGGTAKHRLCIAQAEYHPKPQILAMFRPSSVTEENRLVHEVGPVSPKTIDKLTDPTPMRSSSCPSLPDKLGVFVTSVQTELLEAAKKTVSLLRWRCDIQGPHNPYGISAFEWSTDDSAWYSVPTGTISHLQVSQDLQVDRRVVSAVQTLATRCLSEPIAHELFREAWSQCYRNNRSALVIGIAAIETGVKNCIAQLAPDTRWLLENLQSPPVEKMLIHYLPTLGASRVPNGKRLTVPSALIDPLQKAVVIRNNIIHGRKATVRLEHLEDTLLLIRDFLWLFDYLVGSDWAIHYVRDSTRDQLFQPAS